MKIHRVFFVTQSYLPTQGGVAVSTQRLARSLIAEGCSVLVVTFDYSMPITTESTVRREVDVDIEVLRIGPHLKRTEGTNDQRAISRRRIFDCMEQIAVNWKPTVVLSYYAYEAGIFGAYLASALAIPHVASVRGNDVGRNIFSFECLGVLQTIFDPCARIVCVNEHLRKRVLTAFPRFSKKTVVIKNGTQLPTHVTLQQKKSYIPKSVGWTDEALVGVFLGKPREKKGIGLLLDAYERLVAEMPVKLLVVGPDLDSDSDYLRPKWEKLRSNGVIHVTGHRPRSEALQIASEGDFFALPSIEDGLANALLECMALGLCPIVSEVFDDVVTNRQSGWVFKTNNVEHLTNHIADAYRQPALRLQFGNEAQKHISLHHTASREALEYINIFSQVIA